MLSENYEKLENGRTYYNPCVVSDLGFITTNDWEFNDKLRRTLQIHCVVGIEERTWFM